MGLPKYINGKRRPGSDEAIKQKRTRFKTYKALNNEKKSNEVEKAKAAYNEAK
jgi:hypothetical protein